LNSTVRVAAIAATIALFLGPAAAVAADRNSDDAVSPDMAPAAAYCKQTGGFVETRRPEYGTNDPSPLVLSGRHDFCRYSSGKGSSRSHIYVFLDTLYTQQPTLAALAYYAKVQPGSCQGNPASCYCTLLGGTDLFGGINAAGGAWVRKAGPDPDLDTCIFPDLSSIDSWGLTYHSVGIIRGIDLSTVLRYSNPNLKTHGSNKAAAKAFGA
jgi:putative hemolysin